MTNYAKITFLQESQIDELRVEGKRGQNLLITSITEENRSAFSHLIPEEVLGELKFPGRYCLGGLQKAEDGMLDPVGTLFFAVDKNETVTAEIRWLYVGEKYRKKGVAKELLNSFYHVIPDSGVAIITCKLPYRREYDEVGIYLEKEGFSFQLEDSYELDLTMGEILEHSVLINRKKIENVQNLKSLGYSKARDAIGKVILKWSVDTMPELTKDASLYDLDVSCAFVKNDEVQGLLLVEQCSDKRINLVLMRNITVDAPKVLLAMMLDAVYCAEQKYSKDTIVHIECRSERIGKVIDMMFPDKQPGLVWSGEMMIS